MSEREREEGRKETRDIRVEERAVFDAASCSAAVCFDSRAALPTCVRSRAQREISLLGMRLRDLVSSSPVERNGKVIVLIPVHVGAAARVLINPERVRDRILYDVSRALISSNYTDRALSSITTRSLWRA